MEKTKRGSYIAIGSAQRVSDTDISVQHVTGGMDGDLALWEQGGNSAVDSQPITSGDFNWDFHQFDPLACHYVVATEAGGGNFQVLNVSDEGPTCADPISIEPPALKGGANGQFHVTLKNLPMHTTVTFNAYSKLRKQDHFDKRHHTKKDCSTDANTELNREPLDVPTADHRCFVVFASYLHQGRIRTYAGFYSE